MGKIAQQYTGTMPQPQVPLPSVAPRRMNWLSIASAALAIGILAYVTWYGVQLMRHPPSPRVETAAQAPPAPTIAPMPTAAPRASNAAIIAAGEAYWDGFRSDDKWRIIVLVYGPEGNATGEDEILCDTVKGRKVCDYDTEEEADARLNQYWRERPGHTMLLRPRSAPIPVVGRDGTTRAGWTTQPAVTPTPAPKPKRGK